MPAGFAERQKKARQIAEMSAVNIGSARDLADLQTELDHDPDYATAPQRFERRAGEIRDKWLGSITDPAIRQAFQGGFDALALSQSVNVKRNAFKREADDQVAQLGANLDGYAMMVADAQNELEAEDLIGRALAEIHGKADAGYFTPEAAQAHEQRFLGQLAEAQAARAIETDPEEALARLTDAEDLTALDGATRTRLIDQARRAIVDNRLREQTDATAARRELEVSLPDYLEALRDGKHVEDERFADKDRLLAVLGPDTGERRWAAIEDARRLGAIAAELRWAAPDEIETLAASHGVTDAVGETEESSRNALPLSPGPKPPRPSLADAEQRREVVDSISRKFRGKQEKRKPQTSTPESELVFTDDGLPVMAPVVPKQSHVERQSLMPDEEHPLVSNQEPEQMRTPKGWSLNSFAFIGEALRVRDASGKPLNVPSPAAFLFLRNFRQGGPWDMQRFGRTQGIHPQFRHASNMAIGVFAGAAGFDLEFILDRANSYAASHSKFDPDEVMNAEYPALPEVIVQDIRNGYNFYKSGAIKAKPDRRPRL